MSGLMNEYTLQKKKIKTADTAKKKNLFLI